LQLISLVDVLASTSNNLLQLTIIKKGEELSLQANKLMMMVHMR